MQSSLIKCEVQWEALCDAEKKIQGRLLRWEISGCETRVEPSFDPKPWKLTTREIVPNLK